VVAESSAEENERLRREIQTLKAEIERLQRLLEEALRAGKRQAAPFSRREPKAHPQKPGRKAGDKYGRRCRRPIPQKIDEVVDVPLPVRCPPCGGGVEERDIVSQYQTEIPEPRVQRIEFRIHVGRCQRCERRVRSRHERQTSDAIGSAASQLGPRALALATQLNKGLGLPYGKTQAVLAEAVGLRGSRGGLCRAWPIRPSRPIRRWWRRFVAAPRLPRTKRDGKSVGSCSGCGFLAARKSRSM